MTDQAGIPFHVACALLAKPIAVVAHDAGAANLLAGWLRGPMIPFVCGSLEGPSRGIFEATCDWLANDPACVRTSRTLLSGTGWSTDFEHEARCLAKQAGVYSIAVVDHWTNYRERFVRDGREVLPDEIWVTDGDAERLARDLFPALKIVQLQNSYLTGLAREVRALERRGPQGQTRILYVLEPIRESWGPNTQAGEFQALDYFVRHLDVIDRTGNLSIRLRPHPSDPPGKYDAWIDAQQGLRIDLDDSHTLASAIASSDVVVGCQTYAMIVALAAGRRVVSSIPPWGPTCVLPDARIIKLADLTAKPR